MISHSKHRFILDSAGVVDSSNVSNTNQGFFNWKSLLLMWNLFFLVGIKRAESQMNGDIRSKSNCSIINFRHIDFVFWACYFCGKPGHISRRCFKRRRFEHENGNCHPNCGLCQRNNYAQFDSDED